MSTTNYVASSAGKVIADHYVDQQREKVVNTRLPLERLDDMALLANIASKAPAKSLIGKTLAHSVLRAPIMALGSLATPVAVAAYGIPFALDYKNNLEKLNALSSEQMKDQIDKGYFTDF
jgi:hypothetical protein